MLPLVAPLERRRVFRGRGRAAPLSRADEGRAESDAVAVLPLLGGPDAPIPFGEDTGALLPAPVGVPGSGWVTGAPVPLAPAPLPVVVPPVPPVLPAPPVVCAPAAATSATLRAVALSALHARRLIERSLLMRTSPVGNRWKLIGGCLRPSSPNASPGPRSSPHATRLGCHRLILANHGDAIGHTSMTRVPPAAIATVVAAACACARAPRRTSDSPAPQPARTSDSSAARPIQLRVESHNSNDVVIYVARGRVRQRLGTVTGTTSRVLLIPGRFAAETGGFYLTAHRIGGRNGTELTSPTVSVQPGQTVVWTIEAVLARSTLSVE